MSHSHNHSERDYVAGNRAHFDQAFAAKYDKIEGAAGLPKRTLPFILAEYPLDPDRTTVLDFACGTGTPNSAHFSSKILPVFPGLLSEALLPVTKSILGVDISQAMIDQYNLRISNQSIPPEKMTAICVELKGEEGELDNKKFDVVVVRVLRNLHRHFYINSATVLDGIPPY
jgi:SAM-dependent methyltransferase